MALSANTPFALGAYIGNPDIGDASAEATFEADFGAFSTVLGATPQFLVAYVDQNKPISNWIDNAGFSAASFAASPDARGATPVIGLPMESLADTSLTRDRYFRNFASGQYDGVLQGVVQAWAKQGYGTQYWRPGWEMNLPGTPNYAGDDAQTQADWVKAFQHVYTVLHAAGRADGVNVQVIWNPGTISYSNAEATTNLYPGNAYADVIGADVYSDLYPYSLLNFGANAGTAAPSLAAWMADPANRLHYWSNPAATRYSSDGSGGHSLSLPQILQFAAQQGKPVAIPETGGGNAAGGTDVKDDAAFPQWLAQQLAAAQAGGTNVDFVDIWDGNGGGSYEFSNPEDGKPQEAAAWAQYLGAQAPTTAAPSVTPSPPAVTTGSGSDTLTLLLSEDRYLGDAQFTLSVDGRSVGGTQTVVASHAAGQMQTFTVLGSFGAGTHTVAVDFLNDAYAGTPATDRNLYVAAASYDGVKADGATLSLMSAGTQTFTVGMPATVYDPGSAGGTITTTGSSVVDVGTGAVTVSAAGTALTVNGGAGALNFIGGSGTDIVTAGSGAVLLTAQAGTLTFTAGNGSASVVAGSGHEICNSVRDRAGGTLAISNFNASLDAIHRQGYPPATVLSTRIAGGSTNVVLTDDTRLTLGGVAVSPGQVVFS